MQLAKITSKGQVTLPIDVRKNLGLKEGDKVVFVQSENGYVIANSNRLALCVAQDAFNGEAQKNEITNDADVMRLIKDYRNQQNANND